jgi:electron transfer flavoprotein alpha subunit
MSTSLPVLTESPLVADLMGHHDAFVAPATSNGKNIAPRVAALLDVMQISDILSVEGPKTFTRPTYAGNAIATVESSGSMMPAADGRSAHRGPEIEAQRKASLGAWTNARDGRA